MSRGATAVTREVGVDPTSGRYGDVWIETCALCGSKWLNYSVVYEAFKDSGRWAKGRVTEKLARTITPERAARVFGVLKWYWAGGSYYGGEPFKKSGPMNFGLL